MSRQHVFFAALAACVLSATAAPAAVLITVDKSSQQMVVEVDGRPLHQWPVSTGKGSYDTPSGKFKAFRMERDHFSKEWDEAPMPHSIFFTQRGHAIHGSFDVKRLGMPASHGCVRLAPENAKTLFALVEREGVLNTTVVLTGIAPSGAPAVARRSLPRPPVDEVAPVYGQYGQYQQPQYAQPQYQQPVYGQRYGGNPYYAQQQPYYAQPQPYAQPQYRQPYVAQQGYRYRDPYGEPVYVQPRQRSLFPFD